MHTAYHSLIAVTAKVTIWHLWQMQTILTKTAFCWYPMVC